MDEYNYLADLSLLGKQFLVRYDLCDLNFLKNNDELIKSIVNITTKNNLEIIKTTEHRFTPQGLTVIIILSQSHLAVHTWPETGVVVVDIFVCSEGFNINSFSKSFAEILKAKSFKILFEIDV